MRRLVRLSLFLLAAALPGCASLPDDAPAQVTLRYGCNDFGGTMMEENVVSSAGTTYCLDEAVLCRLIRGGGFVPAQRDNVYDILRIHDGPASPDLSVADWSDHRVKRLHVQTPKTAKATLTVGASR